MKPRMALAVALATILAVGGIWLAIRTGRHPRFRKAEAIAIAMAPRGTEYGVARGRLGAVGFRCAESPLLSHPAGETLVSCKRTDSSGNEEEVVLRRSGNVIVGVQ